MRILFISPQPFFQWRGSPIRVAYDVQALAELGHEVDLLTFPFGEDRDMPGVRIIRIPNVFRRPNVPIGPSFWKAMYDLPLLLTAARLVRRGDYDVVHGIEDGGFVAVLVARRTGIATVFEKHSDPGSYKKGLLRNLFMNLYSRVEAFTIRRASAVIGTGPGLVDQARAVDASKAAHHIPDIPSSLVTADADRVAAVREQLRQSPAEQIVLYVGSFAVYQGIDLMFDAMPRVVSRCPGTRFVIIGGTPQEIEERRSRLREQGIAESVTFLGKIPPDELPDYLAAADVLLSPRIAGKNTPLKLLDYLKAARAIVATDGEANRLILDETTAVLAEPQAGDFAAGIVRALEDDALRERLAGEGRKLIREVYNFDEFKRRLDTCYSALGRRK